MLDCTMIVTEARPVSVERKFSSGIGCRALKQDTNCVSVRACGAKVGLSLCTAMIDLPITSRIESISVGILVESFVRLALPNKIIIGANNTNHHISRSQNS